jgi:hypothetical protein
MQGERSTANKTCLAHGRGSELRAEKFRIRLAGQWIEYFFEILQSGNAAGFNVLRYQLRPDRLSRPAARRHLLRYPASS